MRIAAQRWARAALSRPQLRVASFKLRGISPRHHRGLLKFPTSERSFSNLPIDAPVATSADNTASGESTYDPGLNEIRMKISSDPKSCIEKLASILQDEPNNADALQLMAAALENLNQLDSAKNYLYKAIAVGSDNFARDRKLHCHLAQILRQTNELEAAFDACQAGLSLASPHDWWGRALIHHEFGELESRRGNLENCIFHFETAIKLFDKVGESTQQHVTEEALATAYLRSGLFQKAYDLFLKLITADLLEDPSLALISMSDIALRSHFNFHAARTWLEMAAQTKPCPSAEICYLLGYITAITGDWHRAISHLDPFQEDYLKILSTNAAHEENPLIKSSDFARAYSWSLLKAGRLSDAQRIADIASSGVEHDSDYYIMMARLAVARAEQDEALKLLQTGFEQTKQWDVAAKLILQLVYMGQYTNALQEMARAQESPEVLQSVYDSFPAALLERCEETRRRSVALGCNLLRLVQVANYSSLFLEAIMYMVDGRMQEARRFLHLATAAEPARSDELSRHFNGLTQFLRIR